MIALSLLFGEFSLSKEEGKYQESIQSSTTPDPGVVLDCLDSWKHHVQQSQAFSHFLAGDHKAAMNR